MSRVRDGCIELLASVAIAVAMLFVNCAFEAAGSIPDYNNCGFLAGNLVALSIIFPILCALVVSRTVRYRAGCEPASEITRIRRSARAAGCGAALYFAGGIVFSAAFAGGLPPLPVWLICGAYIGLGWIGGWIGATMGTRALRRMIWRVSQ
jgi:hypothetical protein